MGNKLDFNKNGTANAAVISCGVGLLTLALVNLATESSKTFENSVFALGKWWMPGAQGIGPYSGKETIAMVVWLASWAILHYLWRDKEFNNGTTLGVFLLSVAVATTLIWPPVVELFVHFVKGG